MSMPRSMCAAAAVAAVFLVVLSATLFYRESSVDVPFAHLEGAGKAISFNAAAEARRMLVECGEGNHGCYTDALSRLAQSGGISQAEVALNELQNIDTGVRSCHGMAHIIGQNLVWVYPEKWQDFLAVVNVESCAGGFLHGILEGYGRAGASFTITPSAIQSVCEQRNGDAVPACMHAFGHLALVQEEGDVEAALGLCEGLSAVCFQGVFMEDSFKTSLADHGFVKFLPQPTKYYRDLKAIIARCPQYEGDAGKGCWIDAGTVIGGFYRSDPEGAYAECWAAASQEAMRRSCYLHALATIAVSEEYETPEMVSRLCKPLVEKADPLSARCISYVAASFVYNSSRFTGRAILFCSGVADEYQEPCYRAVGYILRNSVPDIAQRAALCEAAPEAFRDDCAGVTVSGDPSESPFSSS